MTSWIIHIHPDHPEHWDVAKTERVWDMPRREDVRRGDIVYFRFSGGSLAGRGLVSTDVRDSPAVGLPWKDADSTSYRGRIDFAWLEDYRGDHLTWADIKRTGIPGGANTVPRSSDSIVEQRLAAFFGDVESDSTDLPATIEDAVEDLSAPEAADLREDRRARALAAIRLRQGQPAFRKLLLAAYSGRCALTGTTATEVLEAAHILPYMGNQTNIVTNGLLLRADIHTLFDRLLLAIVPAGRELVVRISPEVDDPAYRALDGEPVRYLPSAPSSQPARDYLGQHAGECGWLSTTAAMP